MAGDGAGAAIDDDGPGPRVRRTRAIKLNACGVFVVSFSVSLGIFVFWFGLLGANNILASPSSKAAHLPVLPSNLRLAVERPGLTDEAYAIEIERREKFPSAEEKRALHSRLSLQVSQAIKESILNSASLPAPEAELLDVDDADVPPQYAACDIYQDSGSTAMLSKDPAAEPEVGSLAAAAAAEAARDAAGGPFETIDQTARFNLIVLTYNRPAPLLRLLTSLLHANYSSPTETLIHLEIFIDRGVDKDAVDARVLETARAFPWPHGPKTILARRRHGGLFTQWIDTWQPNESKPNEHAILLEDDLQVSPHFYQWLLRVRDAYEKRPDVAGYTLQKGRLRARPDERKSTVHVEERHPLFMYQLMGSWGFAPRRKSWTRFREWYKTVQHDPSFKPYVKGLLPTEWYKKQEGKGTMWTMHFIYFCNRNRLFTVYANLPNRATLAANWQEGGLHYASKPSSHSDFRPLPADEKLPAEVPENPLMLDWSGHPIKDYYSPPSA